MVPLRLLFLVMSKIHCSKKILTVKVMLKVNFVPIQISTDPRCGIMLQWFLDLPSIHPIHTINNKYFLFE